MEIEREKNHDTINDALDEAGGCILVILFIAAVLIVLFNVVRLMGD